MKTVQNSALYAKLKTVSLKISLVLVLIGFWCCTPTDPKEYRIEGKLENIEGDYFFAAREMGDSLLIDTISVNEKGEFEFRSTIDTLTFVSLYFNQNTKFAYILVDKGWQVNVQGDALLPDIMTVKGGEINDDLTSFKERNKDLLKERAEILNAIATTNKNDSLITRNITNLKNINFKLSNIAAAYIKANPSKIASVILINTFFKDESYILRLDENLALLRGKAEVFPLAAELKRYSDKVKASQVGHTAPNFTLVNRLGKKINLIDYRDKYVMLTFASTTCNACNEERKEAITVYNELTKEKKKIEFLTIILDTEIKPLSKNVGDSVKWQLLPEKGSWAAKTLNLYNIRAIPYNILISPTGIILDRNLPMASLKEKLEEYLPKEQKK